MLQTTPYFYIIKNKTTGLRYAGSKWAQGCHPSEFMTEGGYCTSSKIISGIIESDGLDVFEIEQIVTEFDELSAYEYETNFLVENDCAASEQWYNCHNNIGFDFGSDVFKKHMLMKHGVEHAMLSPAIKAKTRTTNLIRRGCMHPAQNNEVKEKMKSTNLDRYSCEYATQSEEVKAKTIITNLKNFGCENPMQNEEVKAKLKITNINRYGASNYTQSETYRNTFYTCKYCEMKSTNAANMKRYHNDNCKCKLVDDSIV